MTAPVTDLPGSGFSPWLYALRRTLLVVVAIVVGVPVLVVTAGGSDTKEYRAVATFSAIELTINPEGLARLAEAMFRTTDVADDIRSRVDVGGDPLRPPDAIDVLPVRDTIVVRVRALDTDPDRAADLANAGADALVAELNSIGPDLGRFEITDRARPPRAAISQLAPQSRILAGVIGAIGLTVAFVTTWLALYRPVLDPRELAEAVGATWHAEVLVPPGAERFPSPERLAGLGQLQVPTPGTVILAGVTTAEEPRIQLSSAVATALSRRGPTDLVLVGAERDIDGTPPQDVAVSRIGVGDRLPDLVGDANRVVDVSGRQYAVDLLDTTGSAPVVVVAEFGIATRKVLSVSRRIEPSRLEGVVLVRRSTWR